jgi:hypothetical protein
MILAVRHDLPFRRFRSGKPLSLWKAAFALESRFRSGKPLSLWKAAFALESPSRPAGQADPKGFGNPSGLFAENGRFGDNSAKFRTRFSRQLTV